MTSGTYIREDTVREIVFLGGHALLDERVPHLDIFGVPWRASECGDSKVHIAVLTKRDESSGEFIRA
jgi:hypothetical protein